LNLKKENTKEESSEDEEPLEKAKPISKPSFKLNMGSLKKMIMNKYCIII